MIIHTDSIVRTILQNPQPELSYFAKPDSIIIRVKKVSGWVLVKNNKIKEFCDPATGGFIIDMLSLHTPGLLVTTDFEIYRKSDLKRDKDGDLIDYTSCWRYKRKGE